MADALRPDQLATHHPGETVLRMADIVVINKIDTVAARRSRAWRPTSRALAPRATIVRARSPSVVEDEAMVRGKRVLVVEDGPTITHGGMADGAGCCGTTRGFGRYTRRSPRAPRRR